jgi:hypothetical protein
LVSGVVAILALAALLLIPEFVARFILVIIFAALFLGAMIFLVLELFGLKKHGDEWIDWREDPVEPLDQVENDPERSPLFSEVADPEKFPRRLPTAWKRRVPLKKRNRFFSNKRFPND